MLHFVGKDAKKEDIHEQGAKLIQFELVARQTLYGRVASKRFIRSICSQKSFDAALNEL